MARGTHATETVVRLRLSERARARLAEQAASNGTDIAAVAADLIEQAVAQPTVNDLLAPFRKQVAESRMSDAELDAFFHHELESHRREKKAKPA